jgi:hypothetical protein
MDHSDILNLPDRSETFFDFYAIGDSVLLAYHHCGQPREKHFTRYLLGDREYQCIECGETHPDAIGEHELVIPLDVPQPYPTYDTYAP